MKLVFCSDSLNPRQPDEAYQAEVAAAAGKTEPFGPGRGEGFRQVEEARMGRGVLHPVRHRPGLGGAGREALPGTTGRRP